MYLVKCSYSNPLEFQPQMAALSHLYSLPPHPADCRIFSKLKMPEMPDNFISLQMTGSFYFILLTKEVPSCL